LVSVSTFELSFEVGVAKSSVRDIDVWVEEVLICSGKFPFPDKKSLISADTEIEVILVDVIERSIERPKKSSDNTLVGKRKDFLLKH
jgi:hypothetical protein